MAHCARQVLGSMGDQKRATALKAKPLQIDSPQLNLDATDALRWLDGPGEMRERICTFAWSSHVLGPIDVWPQELRASVSLCLGMRFPACVFWGRDGIQIYNDAYAAVMRRSIQVAWAKAGLTAGRSAKRNWTLRTYRDPNCSVQGMRRRNKQTSPAIARGFALGAMLLVSARLSSNVHARVNVL